MEWLNGIMEWLKGAQVSAVLAFVVLAIEFWLGKTTMVKPGSTIEVLLSGIIGVLEFLGIKKKSE